MHKASRALAVAAVPLSCASRSGQHCGHSRYSATVAAALLHSTPQHRRYVCAMPLATSSFSSSPAAVLRTAMRLQHTTTTAATEGASATASPSGAEEASATAPPAEGNLYVDPSRLPSTIPGISQEELAARITAYHTKKSQEASAFSSQALAQEVELMRRSLSPNDFAEYMTKLELDAAAAAKEQAKLAAMSPLELHQYHQKKRRQAVRYEWYKSGMMLFALLGSTALLFSMFVFFR